jgi:hypothetical protein
MTREEAKFVLAAYRSNGQDSGELQFKEALALLKADPELARWFAHEQAMDAAISNQMRTVPVPAGLKAELLAARKTIPAQRWWLKPAWLAAAASFALLLTIGSLVIRHQTSDTNFVQFRHAMVEASLDMKHHLEVTGLDADALKQWIDQHHGSSGFELPAGLADKPIGGCKILNWQGNQVTLLCFMFDGKHEDLFVVEAANLPKMVLAEQPRFTKDGDVTTSAWRQAGKVYLLAGNISETGLKGLF